MASDKPPTSEAAKQADEALSTLRLLTGSLNLMIVKGKLHPPSLVENVAKSRGALDIIERVAREAAAKAGLVLPPPVTPKPVVHPFGVTPTPSQPIIEFTLAEKKKKRAPKKKKEPF